MEYDNKYASNGKGNLGVTLGAIGTGLGVLSGGLNGILGNGCGGATWNNGGGCCSDNNLVNRYEAAQSARIAELETEVKLRDSNIYTDNKILALYQYVDGKIQNVESQICQQNVYNATNTATINCMAGQIAQLMNLTKLVIPNGSVCPGWGNVTVAPATTPTTAG